MKTKLLGAAAGALFLGLSATAANADTITNILNGGSFTPLLSDNSAEFLVNADGNTTETILEVGDRLRGILSINTIENPNEIGIGLDSGNNELTAIFEVQVASVLCGLGGPFDCVFTFEAYDGFATRAASLGFANVTGAAIAFFEDATIDYTRTDGIDAGEDSAEDGDAYWLFGFDGDDDFWSALAASDDISDVGDVTPPLTFGVFNAGLSLLDNPFGIDLGNLSCGTATVNACGSGGVIAPSAENEGFDAWDNVDFTIARVPEPGTLSIVGLGLLGLGYASRRRKNKKS